MRNLLILLFLTSCSPASLEDIRAQAESETARLTQILRLVDAKDDLMKELPKIKKRFNRIADLAIKVRTLQDKPPEYANPSEEGDQLFIELARLYEVPGCRELIESAQADAILRLTH